MTRWGEKWKRSRRARLWGEFTLRRWPIHRWRRSGAKALSRDGLYAPAPAHSNARNIGRSQSFLASECRKGAIREKDRFGCWLVCVGFGLGPGAENDRGRRYISLP